MKWWSNEEWSNLRKPSSEFTLWISPRIPLNHRLMLLYIPLLSLTDKRSSCLILFLLLFRCLRNCLLKPSLSPPSAGVEHQSYLWPSERQGVVSTYRVGRCRAAVQQLPVKQQRVKVKQVKLVLGKDRRLIPDCAFGQEHLSPAYGGDKLTNRLCKSSLRPNMCCGSSRQNMETVSGCRC